MSESERAGVVTGRASAAGRRAGALPGLALVLASCALVFFFDLGGRPEAGGLAYTEAFRATPAVEMLEGAPAYSVAAHDAGGEHAAGLADAESWQERWLVPRLFDRVYVRKPPGMPLAIAASYAVFGESAWSARLVSALAATATAVLAFAFARRWFGPAGGVGAGLAAALTPLIWDSGRHAEIEVLNHLGVAIAVMALVHGAVYVRTRSAGILWGAIAGLGVCLMLIAKGPAAVGVPVAAGAALLLIGSRREAMTAIASMAGVVGAGMLLAWALVRGVVLPENAVIQSPGDFLWQAGKAGDIALLAPIGVIQLLPASLALLFPWGPDAKREAAASDEARRGFVAARACALAVLLTLVGMAIAGVSNPRYAWPVSAALWPVVGYVVGGGLLPHRARIARLMLLGRPWVLPLVLLGAFFAYLALYEEPRRATTGEPAGAHLAGVYELAYPGEAFIAFANDAVEGRPEALRALEIETGGRVLWVDEAALAEAIRSGAWAVVRSDGSNSEQVRMESAAGPLWSLAEVEVAQYRYALVRAAGATQELGPG